MTRTFSILFHVTLSKCIICITKKKKTQAHYFNLSHPTLTFQNNVFVEFFKVVQTVHLESAMWDEAREVLVIILPLHQTIYRVQVNQGP